MKYKKEFQEMYYNINQAGGFTESENELAGKFFHELNQVVAELECLRKYHKEKEDEIRQQKEISPEGS